MALDFLPVQDGDVWTHVQWNAFIQAIMDGTIFSPTAIGTVTAIMVPLSAAVALLQTQVATLMTYIPVVNYRQQFIMTNGQSVIGLDRVPNLDSEMIFLNGKSLPNSGLGPVGVVGYTISGSTITLDSAISSLIVNTDVVQVVYQGGA